MLRLVIREQCRNCGETIGRAGAIRTHEGRVVCIDCKARLGPEIPMATVVRPPSALRRWVRRLLGRG